jgi:pilus assembly protein Flp/PilA
MQCDESAPDSELGQIRPPREKVDLPRSIWKQLLREEDGVTSVEYAVMLALILLTCLVAIASLGGNAGGTWNDNQSRLETAISGP